MKAALWFLIGASATWAALAIWQHRLTEKWDAELDALREGEDRRFSPPRPTVPTSDLLPQKGGMP